MVFKNLPSSERFQHDEAGGLPTSCNFEVMEEKVLRHSLPMVLRRRLLLSNPLIRSASDTCLCFADEYDGSKLSLSFQTSQSSVGDESAPSVWRAYLPSMREQPIQTIDNSRDCFSAPLDSLASLKDASYNTKDLNRSVTNCTTSEVVTDTEGTWRLPEGNVGPPSCDTSTKTCYKYADLTSSSYSITDLESREAIFRATPFSYFNSSAAITNAVYLPNTILSRHVIEFLDAVSIGRLALSCKRALVLAKRDRWLKRSAWMGNITYKERPRLWLDVCGRVRAVQKEVAAELRSIFHSHFDTDIQSSSPSKKLRGHNNNYGVTSESEIIDEKSFKLDGQCKHAQQTEHGACVSRMAGHVRLRMNQHIFSSLLTAERINDCYLTGVHSEACCSNLNTGCWLTRENNSGSDLILHVSRGDELHKKERSSVPFLSDALLLRSSYPLQSGQTGVVQSINVNNQSTLTHGRTTQSSTMNDDSSLQAAIYRNHDDSLLGVFLFELLTNDEIVNLSDIKKDEIDRDVSRTFPHLTPFRHHDSIGQRWMFNVLKALVCIETGVGYCQGMNFVVAGLLLQLHCPVATFWMSLALLRHFHCRNIFSPLVPQVGLRLFQFNESVKRKLPKVSQHFAKHNLQIDFFTQQWLMSIFAYYVEPELLCLIWDTFFLCGWKALFKFGLALLKHMEQDILAAGSEEILQLIQTSRKTALERQGTYFESEECSALLSSQNVSLSEQSEETKLKAQRHSQFRTTLLRIARKIKVTNKDLEELERQFLDKKICSFLLQMPLNMIQPHHLYQTLVLPSTKTQPRRYTTANASTGNDMVEFNNEPYEVKNSASLAGSDDPFIENHNAFNSSFDRPSSSTLLSNKTATTASDSTNTGDHHDLAFQKTPLITRAVGIMTPNEKPTTGGMRDSEPVDIIQNERNTASKTTEKSSRNLADQLILQSRNKHMQGEPVRGIVFTVTLDSLSTSLPKLQHVVLQFFNKQRERSLTRSENTPNFTVSNWFSTLGSRFIQRLRTKPSMTIGGVKRGEGYLNGANYGIAYAMHSETPTLTDKTQKKEKVTQSLLKSELLNESPNPMKSADLDELSSTDVLNSKLPLSATSPIVEDALPKKQLLEPNALMLPDVNFRRMSRPGLYDPIQNYIYKSEQAMVTDGFDELHIRTPSLVFISLRELMARNRPLEGSPLAWDFLSVAQRRFLECDASEFGIHKYHNCDEESEWNRSLELTFFHLGLPEKISVLRQNALRIADSRFRWDNRNSKHAATINTRRHYFYLSLGLWGICLMPPPRRVIPPPNISQQFLLRKEASSNNYGTDSSLHISVWSPLSGPNEGFLLFRFSELLKCRTDLDACEHDFVMHSKQIHSKLALIEKQIAYLELEREKLTSRIRQVTIFQKVLIQRQILITQQRQNSTMLRYENSEQSIHPNMTSLNVSSDGTFNPTHVSFSNMKKSDTQEQSSKNNGLTTNVAKKGGSFVSLWVNSFLPSSFMSFAPPITTATNKQLILENIADAQIDERSPSSSSYSEASNFSTTLLHSLSEKALYQKSMPVNEEADATKDASEKCMSLRYLNNDCSKFVDLDSKKNEIVTATLPQRKSSISPTPCENDVGNQPDNYMLSSPPRMNNNGNNNTSSSLTSCFDKKLYASNEMTNTISELKNEDSIDVAALPDLDCTLCDTTLEHHESVSNASKIELEKKNEKGTAEVKQAGDEGDQMGREELEIERGREGEEEEVEERDGQQSCFFQKRRRRSMSSFSGSQEFFQLHQNAESDDYRDNVLTSRFHNDASKTMGIFSLRDRSVPFNEDIETHKQAYDLMSNPTKITNIHKLHEKLATKIDLLIRNINTKDERLLELQHTRAGCLESLHLLTNQRDAKRYSYVHNLVNVHGLWCPQLPLSGLQYLLEEEQARLAGEYRDKTSSLLPVFSQKSEISSDTKNMLSRKPLEKDDVYAVLDDQDERLKTVECPFLIKSCYEFLSKTL